MSTKQHEQFNIKGDVAWLTLALSYIFFIGFEHFFFPATARAQHEVADCFKVFLVGFDCEGLRPAKTMSVVLG